jgi:hypothetical protein
MTPVVKTVGSTVRAGRMIAKRSINVQHESKKCGLKNGVFTESSMISKEGKFSLLFAHAEARMWNG